MLLTWTVQRVVSSPRGQGLVEYSLILVLVAIVVIAALMILGPVVGNTFSTLNNSLASLPGP
jgi:pilus assembly protein Flp/PilA